jgi:hypothetical protein
MGGLPVITAPQPGPRPITHLSVEVLRRPIESGQYIAIHYAARLADAGAVAAIGSVGELGTADWAHWFNTHRLHGSIGYLAPLEYEAACRATYPNEAA